MLKRKTKSFFSVGDVYRFDVETIVFDESFVDSSSSSRAKRQSANRFRKLFVSVVFFGIDSNLKRISIVQDNVFLDELDVRFVAGSGGDGKSSFSRTFQNQFGGPNGGDGGNGGHIILQGFAENKRKTTRFSVF